MRPKQVAGMESQARRIPTIVDDKASPLAAVGAAAPSLLDLAPPTKQRRTVAQILVIVGERLWFAGSFVLALLTVSHAAILAIWGLAGLEEFKAPGTVNWLESSKFVAWVLAEPEGWIYAAMACVLGSLLFTRDYSRWAVYVLAEIPSTAVLMAVVAAGTAILFAVTGHLQYELGSELFALLWFPLLVALVGAKTSLTSEWARWINEAFYQRVYAPVRYEAPPPVDNIMD